MLGLWSSRIGLEVVGFVSTWKGQQQDWPTRALYDHTDRWRPPADPQEVAEFVGKYDERGEHMLMSRESLRFDEAFSFPWDKRCNASNYYLYRLWELKNGVKKAAGIDQHKLVKITSELSPQWSPTTSESHRVLYTW